MKMDLMMDWKRRTFRKTMMMMMMMMMSVEESTEQRIRTQARMKSFRDVKSRVALGLVSTINYHDNGL
jgi:hypothetical protein